MGLISKSIPFPWQRKHTLNFLKYARQFAPVLLSTEVNLSKTLKLFKLCQGNNCKIGYTSMVIKAAAVAIKQSGIGNMSIRHFPTKRIVAFQSIDAKVTVERKVDGKPVVFPGVIKNAEHLKVDEIERRIHYYTETPVDEIPLFRKVLRIDRFPGLIQYIWMKILAQRSGHLHELLGSFTVTSLGKYGIDIFSPLIASTLNFGIGAVKNRPVVYEEKIIIHPIMTLNLIFDHRAVDGADASRLLVIVRENLESGNCFYTEG